VHAHRPALLVQQARHDPAIATVVAGPAQHRHWSWRPALRNGLGHGLARCAHQDDAGCASGNGDGVGMGHLGGGQDFCGHGFNLPGVNFRTAAACSSQTGSAPCKNTQTHTEVLAQNDRTVFDEVFVNREVSG
jgi:hypothetical protein